jgi:Ser/Thr protein kinase RdoA (MazF antagonist)
MNSTPTVPAERRRVVLFCPSRSEFFLEPGPRGVSLPELSLPGRQRVPVNLNASLKTQWNLDAISLGEVATTKSGHAGASGKYEIVEVLGERKQPPAGLMALPISKVRNTPFVVEEDLALVEEILASPDCLPLCGEPGPFAHFGWFEEVRRWVEEEVSKSGRHLTGGFTQFTAGASFSLLRLETDSLAVWFKAVGEPNLQEYAVTAELAATLPEFVPAILACRSDWHAWLSPEVRGTSLSDSNDFRIWQAAARAFAKLQVASLTKTTSLLSAGARNVRIPFLLSESDRFFETLEHLMRKQIKSRPAPLTSDELAAMRRRLPEILARLGDLDIPDALGHLDLNPGNVVVSDAGSTFIDWAEAAVGPAFLTMQYFLEHFHLAFPQHQEAKQEIVAAYADEWKPMVSRKSMNAAIELLPAATVYAYTASVTAGREMEFLEQPHIAASFRSMGRRLHRELQDVREAMAVD